MANHILELHGCTPEPLGNYLKGLGVFRLIAQQADPQARAWWKEGVLVLHTKWSKKELVNFFLRGIGDEKSPIYSPTPIFAPWGGRPGFYADGNKKAKEQLARLLSLDDNERRFLPAKRISEITTNVLNARTAVVIEKRKPVTKRWVDLIKKDKVDQRTPLKAEIASAMRMDWGKEAVDWFDACLSIEDKARFGFLYGTGGNEGSADITNNFWEMIEETIGLPTPKKDSTEKLVSSLFGGSRIGGTASTAGQHFPLAAGSANCGQGFEGSASTNPWDFILMMEGAVLFAGATTKRLSQLGRGKAAFPFMLDHLAADEPASSSKDEAKQDSQVVRCRAEFWMPLWGSPTSLSALRALLAEGRLQRLSGERTEHTLHAIEAIKTLGVSRGIDTFHRVALFERRGKGYYLASSLGYYPTSRSSASFTSQLTELDDFRQQVYRNLREGPRIPERVMRARRRFHSALATLLKNDEYRTIPISELLREILVATSNVEREVVLLKDRSTLLTPCCALDSAWLRSDGDNHEYRIASSIAGVTAWGERTADGHITPAVEAVRANLLPVARRGKGWDWADTSDSAVWSRGAPVEVNLAAVLRRRLIDARKCSGDGLPLWSSCGAGFRDLLAYWHGEINDDRLADLIHGLALVNFWKWEPGPKRQDRIDNWQKSRPERSETPHIDTSGMWFDENDIPHGKLRLPLWLDPGEFDAACELPRVYHLLKLCFVGGRLPRRPVERATMARSGDEPFPPSCLDILTLLGASRLADAVQLAARRLRAKGYPTLLRDCDTREFDMGVDQCRRLAGMLLIPVRQPGVCAALAIKPEVSR